MPHLPAEGRVVDTELQPSDQREDAPAGPSSVTWPGPLEIPVRFVRMIDEGVALMRLPPALALIWPGVTELHLSMDPVPDDIRRHYLSAKTWLLAQVDQPPIPGITHVAGRGIRLLRGMEEGVEVQAALQRLSTLLGLAEPPLTNSPLPQARHTGNPSPPSREREKEQAEPQRQPAADILPGTSGATGTDDPRAGEMEPSQVGMATRAEVMTSASTDRPADFLRSEGPVLSSLLQQLSSRLKDQDHMIPPSVLREVLLAVLTSCVTGQLTLLSGPPGTGKTSILEHLAGALDATLTVTPVRPAWMEATDLLGFYNARQERYQPTAFLEAVIDAADSLDSGQYHLLTLDELNLSRIENYGADLLSQLEKAHQSARGGELRLYADGLRDPHYPSRLALPTNAVLIGTLNTDETTEALSPKVLDRSFVVKLPAFPLKDRGFPDPFRLQMADSPEPLQVLRRDEFRTALLQTELATFKPAWRALLDWQSKFLSPLGIHLSFRLERVFNLYVRVSALLGVTPDQALDAFTSSKVLPSLHFLRHDTTKLELLGRWRESLPRGCPETAKRIDAMVATSGDVIEYFGR